MFNVRQLSHFFGLSEALDHHDWVSWIDGLPEQELAKISGKLIKEFGRPDLGAKISNCREYNLLFLQHLLQDLSDFIKSEMQIWDYYIGLQLSCCDGNDKWFWTRAHSELWRLRGRQQSNVPRGALAFQIIANNGQELVEYYLDLRLNDYYKRVLKSTELSEKLVGHIESACNYLGVQPSERLGSFLVSLKKCRQINRSEKIDPSLQKCLSYFDEFERELPSDVYKKVSTDLESIRISLQNYLPCRSPQKTTDIVYTWISSKSFSWWSGGHIVYAAGRHDRDNNLL